MPEYVVDIRQPVPPDVEICELTATIIDDGVKVYAKSPILGEFIKKASIDEHFARDFFGDALWADHKIYSLTPRMAQALGGNSIRTEFMCPGREGNYEPNMVWLRVKGLEDGVEMVFPQPAHVPADIIDFLSRSMDKARTFYLRHVRSITVSAKLREVS